MRGHRDLTLGRFPDLGDPRIIACLAAPRGLSQLNHVLRRLWTPRHPPYTLCSLTTLFLDLQSWLPRREPVHLVFKERAPPFGLRVCLIHRRHQDWWRRSDSNRRPPGCKPGALPAELRPLKRRSRVVGLGGFEPLTSRLSGGRSNQLSYKPVDLAHHRCLQCAGTEPP